MKSIVFAREASEQLAARKAWWRQHGDKAPELLDREVTAAIAEIAEHPEAFPVHTADGPVIVRRCLLPRTKTHLFFVCGADSEVVTVVSVWSAVRGLGPPLP